MNTIYQISAGQLTPFLNTFRNIGYSIEPLLSSVGLSTKILEHPQLLIPEYAAWNMTEKVSKKEGIDNLGDIVAHKEQVNCFAQLGKEVAQAQSLLRALKTLIKQLLNHANFQNYWLAECKQYIYLCRIGTPGLDVGQWQMEQYVLRYFISIIQKHLGLNWAPDFIHVQGGKPLHTSTAFSDLYVHYNKPFGVIPIAKRDIASEIELWPRIKAQSVSVKQTFDVLNDMLAHRVFADDMNLISVSSALGVNARKLQRILKQEGASFREMKNQALLHIAKQLLQNRELSVSEIAQELGYQNPKNFARSFKMEQGMTPSEYRQLLCVKH